MSCFVGKTTEIVDTVMKYINELDSHQNKPSFLDEVD